jgi:solute carrier family 25 (mitochondrial phosphate transporter), member 23/24/25/41
MRGSNYCLFKELWNIFHELDLDSNGHLDAEELTVALRKAGEPCPPPVEIPLDGTLSHRSASVLIDTVRIHDLPHLVTSLALDKLSRVS